MNPSLDTAPAPADRVFDVRTLSDEEAHAFGVRVALMARDLGATRTRLAETEQRLAAVLADNEALQSRVRGQKETIARLQKADTPSPPQDLLDRIERALSAPLPQSERPELLGSSRPAEGSAVDDEDDDELDDEDCGPGCGCWVCTAPKPGAPVEAAAPSPAPRWFSRLRWSR